MIVQIWKFPSPVGELHFSISCHSTIGRHLKRFPSPVGELHFSIRGCGFFNDLWRNIISVPCRGTTFLNALWSTIKETSWFPSPVGELHFSMLENHFWKRERNFRPLSGNYISQWDTAAHTSVGITISVPCRGTTFLNKYLPSCTVTTWPYFRPLSGNYISQLGVFKNDIISFLSFPSPVGELHFSILVR